MVEGVLVQEVGFVEEEDRVDALARQLLDVRRHGVEEVAGGGRGREAECEAELPVEVATAERGVVRVGQSVSGGGDTVAQRAQDAGLADPGSPTRSTEARSVSASSRPSATSCLEVGSQRSASAISLENGGSLRPRASR